MYQMVPFLHTVAPDKHSQGQRVPAALAQHCSQVREAHAGVAGTAFLHISWTVPEVLTAGAGIPQHGARAGTTASVSWAVWAPETPCAGNGELISRSAFKSHKEIKNEHGLSLQKEIYARYHFTSNMFHECRGLEERKSVQVLKWPSLLAEPSLSLKTMMHSHPPLGEPLPEHSSTSTTNLHQHQVALSFSCWYKG